MIFIAFIFLLICLDFYGMESNTLITFLPHDYAFDTLQDCGTMAYRPIQIRIFCPSIHNYCTSAFNNTSWWKTQFEPQTSLYVKKFAIFNEPTIQEHYDIANALIGSFCLKIIAITFKKTILKLLKITHYQTSISRRNQFNPEDPTSRYIETNWIDMVENQRESLPSFLTSFKTIFDTIFFQEIKELIGSFDENIEKIHYSNSDLKKTKCLLKLFLKKFDQILTSHVQRKVQRERPNRIIETMFAPFSIALAYMFDY